jgi:hypothetical protein
VPERQDDVAGLLAGFEATLLEMAENRIESGGNPRKWSRLVNRVQSLQLRLRESPEGRAGIATLIAHPVLTVRQWAASYARFWDEPAARAVLERDRAAEPKGLAASRSTSPCASSTRDGSTWSGIRVERRSPARSTADQS